MSQWTYFDKDGTFGNAEDLIFVDTSNFSENEWFELGCVSEVQEAAIAIAESRNASVFSISCQQEADTCNDAK